MHNGNNENGQNNGNENNGAENQNQQGTNVEQGTQQNVQAGVNTENVQETVAAEEGLAPVNREFDNAQNVATATVNFEVKGAHVGKVSVPIGTKVKDAMKMISDAIVPTALQLRDDAMKAVGIDRELVQDTVVTATAKSSGS